MRIEVNGLLFSSKTKLDEHVKQIISEIGPTQSLKQNNQEKYKFFVELFKRHPKYPEKIDGMCDVSITCNKIGKGLCLNIIKQDGTIDDISWKMCVSGKEKDRFKEALRVAIHDQISLFRETNETRCALCVTTKNVEYHIDHEIHFEELVHNFLKTCKLNKPTQFQNAEDNRKKFKTEDENYENEWKIYHKQYAKLRILCKSCNLKRPHWREPE
jgi:hypothetical protein